jgi:hypothetical protein
VRGEVGGEMHATGEDAALRALDWFGSRINKTYFSNYSKV